MNRILLKAQQAADVYGVSERKFHNMRSKGFVPAPVVLGPRSLRWVRSELEAALANLPRQQAAQPEPEKLRRARGAA